VILDVENAPAGRTAIMFDNKRTPLK